jgi:hypothetical protein
MFILKGIDQLEKAIAKAKKVRRASNLIASDVIAFQAAKAIIRLFAARMNADIKRWLAPVKARKRAWFATIRRRLYRCISD